MVTSSPDRSAPLAGQHLDDGALVGVEVGLDQVPEAGHVGVHRGRVADHPQDAPDAPLALRELRAFSRSSRSGMGSSSTSRYHGEVGDRLIDRAAEQHVPHRPQQAALRVEGQVHGLQRHARLGGDGGHRGGDVAVALEQPLRGFEDVGSRALRPAPGGGVSRSARGLTPSGISLSARVFTTCYE